MTNIIFIIIFLNIYVFFITIHINLNIMKKFPKLVTIFTLLQFFDFNVHYYFKFCSNWNLFFSDHIQTYLEKAMIRNLIFSYYFFPL